VHHACTHRFPVLTARVRTHQRGAGRGSRRTRCRSPGLESSRSRRTWACRRAARSVPRSTSATRSCGSCTTSRGPRTAERCAGPASESGRAPHRPARPAAAQGGRGARRLGRTTPRRGRQIGRRWEGRRGRQARGGGLPGAGGSVWARLAARRARDRAPALHRSSASTWKRFWRS
jgi:hypothetical protein